MADREVDTERVSVRTYVPQYQLDAWDEHAEELDMNRSEYVKAMVQAGRRGFRNGETEVTDVTDETDGADGQRFENGGESRESDQTSTLESQVVDALSTEGYLSWEELLGAVTDDIERRLEETLQDLQTDGRIRYSGRNGGYTLDE